MEIVQQIIRVIRIYLRVSSIRQEIEETIETQRDAIERYVAQTFGPECKIEYTYEDDGYSGEYLERPGIDELRGDLHDDSWNTVVTYAPDRISRDFNHGNMLVDEILAAGKDIFYVNGPSPSKESKLITRIMSAISADDKEKTLKKLYDGKLRRANNKVINNSTAPYGYTLIPKSGSKSSPNFKQTHLIINEEEASVVRMIFNWVGNDRYSTRQVVMKLAELGIKPKKSKRGVWNTSTLSTLLKNETYIGKARFRSSYAVEPLRRIKPVLAKKYPKVKKTSRRIRPRDEWIWIDKGIPAILEGEEGLELFQRTQHQLKNNRRESTMGNKKSEAYLLNGRIRCSCGYTRNRSGSESKRNIYYTCSSGKSCYPDKPCAIGGVNTRIVDDEIWKTLNNICTDPMMLSEAIRNYYEELPNDTNNNVGGQITTLQEQIKRLKGIELRIKEAYEAGSYTTEELKERLIPVRKDLSSATKRIEALSLKAVQKDTSAIDDNILEKVVCYAPDALKNLSFEEKREIVLDSVTNVVAVPGTLDVTGSVSLQEGILLTDRNKLKLKGNKASIASPYYVYLKTISRNCGIAKRREVDLV